MTFKAIVGIVLGAMLANNYALEKFLGAAPLLGWSAQEKKITVLGVSVTVAMVLTALIAGLVQTYVLDALSLGYLQTLVFAAIVLIVVYAINAVAKAAFKKDLGVYFPVIALNSAVLGLAVNNAADALALGESILTALGAGLGFWARSRGVCRRPLEDPRALRPEGVARSADLPADRRHPLHGAAGVLRNDPTNVNPPSDPRIEGRVFYWFLFGLSVRPRI